MKTIHNTMLSLLVGICTLGACASPVSYTLTGRLSGLPDSTKVALLPAATHGDEDPVAEALVLQGKFEIKGELAEPRLFYLRVGEGRRSLRETIMLEPGNITVEADVTVTPERWTGSDARVTGSASHQLYKEKMHFRKLLDEEHAAMQRDQQEFSRKLAAARVAGDTALLASLERSPENAALRERERAFFRRVGNEIHAAIEANSDSYWGPLLALLNYNYFTVGDTAITRLFERFPDAVKESYYGQIMRREAFPPRLVGKPLPAFSLPDRAGVEHASDALRAGKRLLLVDFWASWCGPCRREIPRLKEIHAAFASRGLEIISISIDKDPAAWLKALDEEQMPWPQLHDTANLFAKQFFGTTIPALFLVDANGTVLEDLLRGEALQARIAGLLNGK
ncbi:MAG: AhpC/TSA family protein [Odoribacteraceae bacterium]|jgi:thiol-disulfide isomerase/thioredoxin|nr:AhpC/TSA family protein [Odoribacteraceae bacterium]